MRQMWYKGEIYWGAITKIFQVIGPPSGAEMRETAMKQNDVRNLVQGVKQR